MLCVPLCRAPGAPSCSHVHTLLVRALFLGLEVYSLTKKADQRRNLWGWTPKTATRDCQRAGYRAGESNP